MKDDKEQEPLTQAAEIEETEAEEEEKEKEVNEHFPLSGNETDEDLRTVLGLD